MSRVRLVVLAFAMLLAAVAPVRAAAPAKPVISYIFYDGAEFRAEGDEYAVIANQGGTEINLKGYRLYAGDPGQNFRFPSYVLKPGAKVMVYTNRTIKGAFSYGRRSAIWNNDGDCGTLFNAAGAEADEYCY